MNNQQSVEVSHLILLGNRFLINPSVNEISHLHNGSPGSPLKIEPKVMRVLMSLLEKENELVTKEYLTQEIWEGYGGAEEALMQAISKLRRTFNDSVKNSTVIETIPKQGYRLLMSSQEVGVETFSKEDHNTTGRSEGFFFSLWDRLVQPKYLIVFLIVAFIVLGLLGILSQIVFWS